MNLPITLLIILGLIILVIIGLGLICMWKENTEQKEKEFKRQNE